MAGNDKTNTLVLILMGAIALLMVANVVLFLRMNQLQEQVLASLTAMQTGGSQETGLAIGTKAPAFALTDTDGAVVSLEDFAGHKVLLGFSSTACSFCAQMYPNLGAFSNQGQDVQILLISRGTLEENRQLVEANGFTFPVLTLTQENVQVGQDYEVPGTPFFYVINERGVVCSANFATTPEQLASLVSGCRD